MNNMGIFGKIFGKKESVKIHKGYTLTTVSAIVELTSEMVQISFDITGKENAFIYKPGMHIHVSLEIDGKEEIRSYSICGGGSQTISIGVKKVDGGKVSNWLCDELNVGDEIAISHPTGNFILDEAAEKIVTVAAGSGITPIYSMLQNRELAGKESILLFGNRTEETIPFKNELANFQHSKTFHYLSQEKKDGFNHGRITKEAISEFIKNDLTSLKADAFYLCGPEEMIINSKEVLELFGVNSEKIHFELFTTPVLMKSESSVDQNNQFSGVSKIEVILDGEKIELELDGQGKSILDAVNEKGFDAPYSCRGGVCSTCRAKVTEGRARMEINYALTDKEVEEGYILSCQAHPTSECVKLSYDE